MRADQLLVERGLAATRSQAQRLIASGVRWRDRADWRAVAKNGEEIPPQADIELLDTAETKYVSRGGLKLQAALAETRIEVRRKRCLDAGQSTGGFTDCLLRQDAGHVTGVDVGHGQLHPSLRADPRVTVIEKVNARELTRAHVGSDFDLIVADLSFISLRRVIGPLVTACRSGGSLVLLVKPQFEAGRQEVSKGKGVISDPAIHDRVIGEIEDALVAHGCTVVGWTVSTLAGADGNREFLVHARTPRQGSHP